MTTTGRGVRAILVFACVVTLLTATALTQAPTASASGLSYINAAPYGSSTASLRNCGVTAPFSGGPWCGAVLASMPNGTAIAMHCWTDSEAPTTEDHRFTSPRWFFVTDVNSNPQYSGFVYSDLVSKETQTSTPQCPDSNSGVPTGPNSIFSQYPQDPSDSSVTVSQDGGNLEITVLDEFPTGPATVYCHAGDGYPTGGSVSNLGQVNIALSWRTNADNTGDWYASWTEPSCASSGSEWIGINAGDGLAFYSNVIDVGSSAPPADPGYLIGIGNEKLSGSQQVNEPIDLVGGGVENAGGSPLHLDLVTFTMISPSGDYYDGTCSDPGIGNLIDVTLQPGQQAVCRASVVPDQGGDWPFEIDYMDSAGDWHRGELYNPGDVQIQDNRPSNDDFAGAQTADLDWSMYEDTSQATVEDDEPSAAEHYAPTSSVWFDYTAQSTGAVVLDTAGSNYDTAIGVFTGDALGDLDRVASDDDHDGSQQAKLTLHTTVGTAYHIAVDAAAGSGADLDFSVEAPDSSPTVHLQDTERVPFVRSAPILRWSAHDASFAIEHYEVRRRTLGLHGHMSAWTNVGFSTNTQWQVPKLSSRSDACYAVRAVDTDRNVGAWSTARCLVGPIGVEHTRHSGHWTLSHGKRYVTGRAMTTVDVGASLTTARFGSVRRIGLSATFCPRCGQAEVLVDGVYVTTFNLESRGTSQGLLSRTLPEPMSGKVEVVDQMAHRRLSVDGIFVGRS